MFINSTFEAMERYIFLSIFVSIKIGFGNKNTHKRIIVY